MKKEITTFEEFKENVGKNVNCVFMGEELENAEIYYCSEEGSYYLIHKDLAGGEPPDRTGVGSWCVYAYDFEDRITDMVLVEEEPTYSTSAGTNTSISNKEEQYYYKDSPKKPSWFDGRPVLVYYSDESEDKAVETGNIGWLVQYDPEDGNYSFKVVDEYNTLEDNLNYAMDINDYGDYTYVVPVVRESEELKDLKKQREELDAKIALLESKEIN